MAPERNSLTNDRSTHAGKDKSDAPAVDPITWNDVRLLNKGDRIRNSPSDFGHLEITGHDEPPHGGQHKPQDTADTGLQPVDHREPAVIQAEKQANTLASSYGLNVEAYRNQDGQIEYHYYVPADKNHPEQDVLTTTDSDPERALEQARLDEIRKLEDAYGVNINGAGKTVMHGDTALASREPNFAELAALDTALLHAQPSQLNADGSKTDINFFDKPSGDFSAVGFYKDNAINLVDITNGHDAEKIVEHELGHHAQDDISGHKGTLDASLDERYSELGWTRDSQGRYLLQSKDGALYLPLDKAKTWVRVNTNGEFLDANGQVVTQDKAETLTNQEMYNMAKVPHVHEPMPATPNEHDAEAQAYFRNSREYRTQLYEASPQMYEAERRADQEQIDKFYGKDENGRSRYIRNPDGLVVPNTMDNMLQVMRFEFGLRKGAILGNSILSDLHDILAP